MTIYSNTKSAPSTRAQTGPFDVSEAVSLEDFADFGSIKIRPVDGMDIRLEVEEGSGRIIAVAVNFFQSSLQLQAFAAPKTEGLWAEVRSSIISSVKTQGGIAEERLGSFGPEVAAQVPVHSEEGAETGKRSVRFVGVDGPRWFLRGMITGAATMDPAAASLIEGVFRSVVVDRGSGPIPPRELLDLKVPPGVVTPPLTALV
ncbi:MAG: DUF3710 domain-containing protein [Micrococcales bacterium]